PDANLVNAMRAAAAGLRLGKVLMLFPEGERTIDGTLKPFRKGAAILGAHVGVPVVPVGVSGFYPLWPRGRRFQWRALVDGRARGAAIAFGEPMRMRPGDYGAAAAALQHRVAELVGGERSPHPQGSFSVE